MKKINVPRLQQYSISKDGRVFLGEKEINGIWRDSVTYPFPPLPTHSNYPIPCSIQDIYEKTFGVEIPKKVMNRINKLKNHVETYKFA